MILKCFSSCFFLANLEEIYTHIRFLLAEKWSIFLQNYKLNFTKNGLLSGDFVGGFGQKRGVKGGGFRVVILINLKALKATSKKSMSTRISQPIASQPAIL